MMSAAPASAISPPAMKSASVGAAAAGTPTLKRKTPELAEEITKGTGTTENKEPSTSEGSHILKLKKEAFAADGLWREMLHVPGGMHRWLKAREEVAKAEEARPKKRKKVVKTSLTPKYIEFLRTFPTRTMTDISDERLSRKSETFRREYLMRKYIDGKWADYRKALVKQYDLLGHAEDEDELTDDEDDDVVKMRSLAIH
jgi:hypothetical protein